MIRLPPRSTPTATLFPYTPLFRSLPLAFLLLAAAFVAPAQEPLPRDSVYQLPVTLTDQDGQSRDWRSKRGTPQVVAMFYTSCQYVCPLIVDSGKAVERALSTDERAQQFGRAHV